MNASSPSLLTTVLDVLQPISAMLVVIAVVLLAYGWWSGPLPALLRLGRGLGRGRVAIFARGEALEQLRRLVTESGLLRRRQLVEIDDRAGFHRAREASLYLVHYPDWTEGDGMGEILRRKPPGTPVLVYAPQGAGRVPAEVLEAMEQQRHAVLCNFRGRLLNDLMASMMVVGWAREGSAAGAGRHDEAATEKASPTSRGR